MREVYSALEASNIVVLGSPVYFDTVSAQTKLMIDRCNCLKGLIEEGDGAARFQTRLARWRVGVLVAVAGLEQDVASIRATAAGFFTWITADFVESVLYPHAGEGKRPRRRDLDAPGVSCRHASRGLLAAATWLAAVTLSARPRREPSEARDSRSGHQLLELSPVCLAQCASEVVRPDDQTEDGLPPQELRERQCEQPPDEPDPSTRCSSAADSLSHVD